MKKQDYFKMEMESNSVNEAFARAAVAAFVARLDPSLEELNDIKTAVSEAVTNCIVHAYRDCIGKIHISTKILDDNFVSIVIKDYGCGIENIEEALKPMFTTGGTERSGMGFTVMESFMDKLTVRSKPGRGTSIIMVKKILPRYAVEKH